jgi:hypothetical protein
MPESAIENILSQVNSLPPDERRALVAALTGAGAESSMARRSAYGKYAGRLTPVEEFLREKHEQAEFGDAGETR